MISWVKAIRGQLQESAGQRSVEHTDTGLWTESSLRETLPPPVPFVERRAHPPSRIRWWMPVLWLVPFTIAGFALYGRERQRGGRLDRELGFAQQQMDKLMSQNQGLSDQLARLETDRYGLDDRIFALNAQLAAAAEALEQANGRLIESQALSEQFRESQERLDAALTGERDGRERAEEAVAKLEEDKRGLGRTVARLRQQMQFLERDYRDISVKLAETQATAAVNPHVGIVGQLGLPPGAVQLDPVTVAPAEATQLAVHARVVGTDDRNHFVIIDRGRRDGVREGMVLEVRRGSMPVGQVTVLRVRDQLAACGTASDAPPKLFRAGDLAMQRTP